MRLFGHPVHLMLVHFPSALLPMEFVCYLLYFITGGTYFGMSAFFALVGAVIIGWCAAGFGLGDLIRVRPERESVLKTGLAHGAIQTSVLIVYTVIGYGVWRDLPDLPSSSGALLIIKGVLIVALLIGNYLGGNLLLKHKIGVQQTDER